MRRPGNVFLLAILVGALSAAMVYRYLHRMSLEIEAARHSGTRPTVDVVVASDTIGIGARIEATQVKTVPWPSEAEPEGALHDTKAAVGALARNTIQRNAPLTQTDLVTDGAGLLPLIISEGMRGMSVRVDNVTGVSGFITPNSHVDVLISGQPDGNQEQKSKVVLQNIRVLATGTLIEKRDNKPVEVPTVTLLVSPEDAEKLTLATRFEPLRLALRNYRDEDLVHTSGVSTRALFDSDGKPAKTPGKPERARGPANTVEILLGEKLTRQPLF